MEPTEMPCNNMASPQLAGPLRRPMNNIIFDSKTLKTGTPVQEDNNNMSRNHKLYNHKCKAISARSTRWRTIKMAAPPPPRLAGDSLLFCCTGKSTFTSSHISCIITVCLLLLTFSLLEVPQQQLDQHHNYHHRHHHENGAKRWPSSVVTFAHGYNLDSQKALIKHGPRGSYFGYSLAQHSTSEQANGTFRAHVLVGAPRADSSRSASLAGVVRPGAVYRCDFSMSQSCHLLDIDSLVHSQQYASSYYSGPSSSAASSATNSGGTQETNQDQQQQQPTSFITAASRDPVAQRDNQWLGVTVKSQGPNGYAVACAHRYVLKGPQYRWPQGICYSLTRNLTLHKTWQPCLNRPVNKAHEEYGFCQAGASGDISDSNDIVLGTPGAYTWRGTVFSNSISFQAKDDRTWYMAPVQDDEARVYKYSYLGMSTLTGRFFSKTQQSFISGAPRSNEVGQVLVMSKVVASGAGGRPRASVSDSNFKTDQILDGEQIGSSFGYTLTKLDFNGDGRPDLVVGAPFYYSKTEGGAVYAYANDAKTSTFVPATLGAKLTGKHLESRYGFALANCGDLNHDKYEDLAIGAPYDPQGGAVYIHLGSAQGPKPQASQVIKASAVASNLQTFGYSLSGGLDMDQNGYPDLAVGSYADDSVFILRARPIIEIVTRIEGNLTRIDPNRTQCDNERNSLPCFKFNACFELDAAKLGEHTDSMRLKYRIEAETFTGQKYSRVKFQESENSEQPQVVEKEILLEDYYRGIKLKRCDPQRVYLRDKSDVQTPIQFKLTYSLVQPGTSQSSATPIGTNRYSSLISSSSSYSLLSSSSLSSSPSSSGSATAQLVQSQPQVPVYDSSAGLEKPFPILNQEEAQRIFSARFLKDCGANDICESHLDVDGSLQMPRETLGINEPGFPQDKQINVTIRVANNQEPAYEAKLFVNHPTQLIYSGFRATKQAALIECVSIEKGIVKCDLGNPMPKGSTKLLMLFNTQNQPGTFDFQLMVNTTSQNAREARTTYDLSGTIRKKVEAQIPIKLPPSYPETPSQDPPAWLILVSILLGVALFSALLYCLYINGFFDRPKQRYMAAEREEPRFE